jgi:hypothetical protein
MLKPIPKVLQIIIEQIQEGLNKMKYDLKKINLKETNLKKLLTKHSDAGYIIITAFRGENEYTENVKRNQKLKSDIDKSGYSYIPVWGGFIETDIETGEQKEVKERSFIVLNFKRGTIEPMGDSEGLKELGRKLCKKYEQESYLYKPQGKETKAYYLTGSGKVDMMFSTATPTKSADMYFTNLAKSSKKSVGSKAFTYREGVIWLAQSPKSLAEAYKRMGEVFFRFKD